jgi:hypothetical protein
MRWRTQEEVFKAKGQLTCGNKACESKEKLASFEVSQPGSESEFLLGKFCLCGNWSEEERTGEAEALPRVWIQTKLQKDEEAREATTKRRKTQKEIEVGR